jgi:hypothetical protein
MNSESDLEALHYERAEKARAIRVAAVFNADPVEGVDDLGGAGELVC